MYVARHKTDEKTHNIVYIYIYICTSSNTNVTILQLKSQLNHFLRMTEEEGGHRGHDRMVVGFTTTCAIRAYHH
jgi:hypothetical protein